MNSNLKLADVPQPNADSVFKLQKIDTISFPHPYCITPKHVAYASDHCSGMLGREAIVEAEKRGACCDICRTSGNGILSFEQHETNLTLFIVVPQNKDLNAVPGLPNYLFSNKQTFIDLGVQGFAFPKS